MGDWDAYLSRRAHARLKKSIDMITTIIHANGPMTTDTIWGHTKLSMTHVSLVVRFGVLIGKFLPVSHIHGRWGHREYVYVLNTPRIHDTAWRTEHLKGALCTCIPRTSRGHYRRTAP